MWVWIVSSVIIAAIAIVGNATVLYIIATRKTLRTTANVFISSLAASDLGVGLSSFVPGAYFSSHYLPSEGALQETFNILSSMFYTASVLNLCMMTLDRYIAIAFPYKYLAIMSRGHVVFLVLFCWLGPLLTSLIPLLWFTCASDEKEEADVIFYPTVSVLFVLTCYVILIPVTLHVYCITRRHLRSITAVNLQLGFNYAPRTSFRGANISSSKLLMIAAVVFILCYSVQLSQEICDLYFNCSFSSDLPMCLLLLNSAINPFIYSFHKRDIRKELKRLSTRPRCIQLTP